MRADRSRRRTPATLPGPGRAVEPGGGVGGGGVGDQGFPVARGGDAGDRPARGRAHHALQLGRRGGETRAIGTEQGVGVEVGHERVQQPGEGGAGQ